VATVRVGVRRAGRVVATIERPLRNASGGPAVAYQRRIWRLADGHIDIDGPSLDDEPFRPMTAAAAAAAAAAGTRQASPPPPGPVPTLLADLPFVAETDDSAIRAAIIAAPASVRQLVDAGPGTGKTELAARRLAGLLGSGLSAGQILVLSFSRSAVRTLTRRMAGIGQSDSRVVEDLRHLSVRTFDSWSFRMLRLMGEQPRTLLSRTHDLNIAALAGLAAGPRRDELRACIGDRRHLIVDEFQDLPGVRGDLVLALLALLSPPGTEGCGFTILGDPAQAIYAFARGQRIDGTPYPPPAEYWREVRRLYGDGLVLRSLTQNHRATGDLARLSSGLRSVLLGDQPDAVKLQVMLGAIASLPDSPQPLGPDLLQSGKGESRAILTRTNGEALRVLQQLLGMNNDSPAVPVRLHAGSHATLPPAWIGALLRRLRSTSLPRSQFDRIYAHLAAAWGPETCSMLGLPEQEIAWARLARASGAAEDATAVDTAELRLRLAWPDAFPDDQPLADEGIIVTTVHQSKGMEFDVVTLLDPAPADEAEDEEGDGEGSDSTEDDGAVADDGEQANVAFVGMSRAGRHLQRAGHEQIHRPPRRRRFADGRRRLCFRNRQWVNLEMGLKGDVDPLGFADPGLLGSAEAVGDLQEFLLAEARRLHGRKVMLCKAYAGGNAEWHIHLQEGRKPGRLIGRTANQLSVDLLHLLHKRGYRLPPVIMNLRISSVGTISSESLSQLGEPERTSGFWLGVGLFGTGDFQPRKEKKE